MIDPYQVISAIIIGGGIVVIGWATEDRRLRKAKKQAEYAAAQKELHEASRRLAEEKQKVEDDALRAIAEKVEADKETEEKRRQAEADKVARYNDIMETSMKAMGAVLAEVESKPPEGFTKVAEARPLAYGYNVPVLFPPLSPGNPETVVPKKRKKKAVRKNKRGKADASKPKRTESRKR